MSVYKYAPRNPNPRGGYRAVEHCPECGAFCPWEFARVGWIRIDCSHCDYHTFLSAETITPNRI